MGQINATGRAVKTSADKVNDDLFQARTLLYDSFTKSDPVEKNNIVVEALKILDRASLSNQNILEICVKSARRGSYKKE